MKANTIFSLDEIKNFVDGLTSKTQFGLAAVTLTEPKMNKRGNPYFGRVQKVSYYRGFMFANYENTINGASAAKSGATGTYIADAPSYCHHVPGLENVLLQNNKDSEQYYLNLLTKKTTTTIRSTYLVDGKVATEEQVAEIAQWLPSHTNSKKQEEFGITDEEQVLPLRPKLQNVICLTDTPAEAKAVYEQMTTA